jgi:hypothetical protein
MGRMNLWIGGFAEDSSRFVEKMDFVNRGISEQINC